MTQEDADKNKTEDKREVDDFDAAKLPAKALPAGKSMPKIISFDDLARCGDEIWIENNGQIYFLRKTKQGKLILTK